MQKSRWRQSEVWNIRKRTSSCWAGGRPSRSGRAGGVRITDRRWHTPGDEIPPDVFQSQPIADLLKRRREVMSGFREGRSNRSAGVSRVSGPVRSPTTSTHHRDRPRLARQSAPAHAVNPGSARPSAHKLWNSGVEPVPPFGHPAPVPMPALWTTLVAAGGQRPRWAGCVLVMALVCSGGLADANRPGEARPQTPRRAAGAQVESPATAMRSAAIVGAAAAPDLQLFPGSGISSGPDVLPAPVVTHRILVRSVSLSLSASRGTMNMQPAAARAFDRAFGAARRAGLSPYIRSGWRSQRLQQILFDRGLFTRPSPLAN